MDLKRLGGVVRPWLTLAIVVVLFSLHPDFLRVFWQRDNLPDVLQQSARNVVLAVGMSFVVLTGGIDLSIGSVLALSGVGMALVLTGQPTLPIWICWIAALPLAAGLGLAVFAHLKRNSRTSIMSPIQGISVASLVAYLVVALSDLLLGYLVWKGVAGGVKLELAILFCLLVGAGCGLINGLVVSLGRVPPFIATLGMLTAARGLTLTATDGSSVTTAMPRLLALGQGGAVLIVTLMTVVVGSLFLTRTQAGRYLLAIGGNEQASRLTGLDVRLYKTLAYSLSGMAAALGALLVTARFGLASTNAGTGAELDAIAAVVIGGTSLSGGRGTIIGALVGALTITVITMGLVLIHVKNDLQPVILGAVIVLTVFIDNLRKR